MLYQSRGDLNYVDDDMEGHPDAPGNRLAATHVHEWERGIHMAEAFGIDGRRYACAICGQPKEANR